MQRQPDNHVTRDVFTDPIVQLAALCPLCALAALSPAAALSALSPVLRIFNPAINPAAALLSFTAGTAQATITAKVQARAAGRLTGVMLKVQRGRQMRS
ncbi:MAG: hypothetical protein K0R39_966 [Symbiobacteriaceae bacterium]|jgi:hypothetical protein|nr:hypothetical protein [Symbiobacteriaceae bacterium]